MIWWIFTFITTLEDNSPIPSPALGMKQSQHIFDTPLRLFGGMRKKVIEQYFLARLKVKKRITQVHLFNYAFSENTF